MSTSKADLNKILTKLEPLGDFTARPMMGEFLLYHNSILIGGVYDNRLLIKKTNSNASCGLAEEIPYNTAKRTMYYIANFDDLNQIKNIITNAYNDLKNKLLL